MAEKEVVISEVTVRSKGIFDLSLLYKKLYEWLLREGYGPPKEVLYAERVKAGSKQVEIVWETSKEEEDIFELGIGVSFFVTQWQEVDVQKDNKKMRLDQADVKLVFSANLTKGVGKKDWPEGGLRKRLYNHYFFVNNIEHWKVELYEKTLDLVDETKNLLNLYKF